MWNSDKAMKFQDKSTKYSSYGLNKAPRAWYSHIDSYLTENGFHISESEPMLYTKVNDQCNMLIVCMYVDDLIFTGNFGIKDFRTVMESEFEMFDLGLMKFFLGVEVQQSESGIFKSQSKYASAVLKRFNVSNCKVAPTPVITCLKLSKNDDGLTVDPTLFKRLVGSLMYLTATRTYIMYGASLISIFMESPKDSHQQEGKIILRYVCGTKDLGIMYLTS